jgi:ribulose-phosphate 3-epimerase
MQITPAVLPHTFQDVTEKLSRVEGVATRVQIDLCDGVFGREKTWYPSGDEVLPAGFEYEFDIMVNDWRPVIEKCLILKPMYLVMHVDQLSEDELKELIEMLRPLDVKLGIAVSNDKNIDFLADMLRLAVEVYGPMNVYIQVMGIQRIGEQAQPFDEDVIERIIAIKQRFGEMMLQVDGGMTPDTASRVHKAGARIAVVGSYIFADNDSATALSTMRAVGEAGFGFE